MKKRHLNAFTALCTGIVFLAGMIIVNGQNIGGYTLGKEALKNAIFMTNYTMEISVESYLDDTLIMKEYNYDKCDGNDNSHSINEYYQGDERVSGHEYIRLDGRYYNRGFSDEKYTTWTNSGMYHRSAEDKDREQNQKKKIVKFGELLGDAVIGDLKNNIVTTVNENNYTVISIDLDDTQIPELYNAGLSVIMPEAFSLGNTSINMAEEIRAKNVKATVVTDENKNFKTINAEISMEILSKDGSIKNSLSKIDFVFSDIGTTVIEPVDESMVVERNADVKTERALEPAAEVTEN